MSVFPRPLSTLTIVSLVLLRFVVGWHFFREGVTKFQDDSFSSAYLLQQSTGPLAGWYQSFVRDPYELERLDEERMRDTWEEFHRWIQEAAAEEDKKKVDERLQSWNDRLTDYFAGLRSDLVEYRAKAEANWESGRDRRRRDQQFERENVQRNRVKLSQMRAPWIGELRMMDELFREELAAVVDRPAGEGPPGLYAYRQTWVDTAVKWTVLLVGIMLLVGLLVPLASIVGIGFLLSVWLSQPFWVPDAVLTYSHYQAVEMAALVVLAATSAGRFAGLDFFWYARNAPKEQDK